MILIALKCEQKMHSFVTLLQRKCVDGIRERNIELDKKGQIHISFDTIGNHESV